MSNDKQTRKRDSLYQILEDVEKRTPEIEQIGHEMVRSARLARDVATSIRDFVAKIPNDDMLPEENWQRAIDGWGAVRDAGQPIVASKNSVTDFMITVSGSTVSANSMVYAIGPVTPAFEPVLESAKGQLARIMDGFPLMSEVRSSITRLGLDVRVDKRSALQLLKTPN